MPPKRHLNSQLFYLRFGKRDPRDKAQIVAELRTIAQTYAGPVTHCPPGYATGVAPPNTGIQYLNAYTWHSSPRDDK